MGSDPLLTYVPKRSASKTRPLAWASRAIHSSVVSDRPVCA